MKDRGINESDLYLALEDLVIYTLDKQLEIQDKSPWTPNIWATEKCSVRFSGPRGCGHSEAVMKLCKYIFKNPLLIVQNTGDEGVLKQKFDFAKIELPYRVSCHYLYTIKGGSFDSIIIDNASYYTTDWINEIYYQTCDMAYNASSFCYVLVG